MQVRTKIFRGFKIINIFVNRSLQITQTRDFTFYFGILMSFLNIFLTRKRTILDGAP